MERNSWERWAWRIGFVAAIGAAAPAAGQSGGAIEYELRFPEAASHYMEIEASYPTGGRDVVEVMMAVWTPGSYLVREYARHVEDIEASTPDGRDADVVRVNQLERAVRVPAGDVLVRTKYEPGALRLGGALSVLAALALVLHFVLAVQAAGRRA